MAEKGNIFTGARARFSIEGIKVGFARNVSMREMLQLDPAIVLDNIEVAEHVPTGYEVSMSCEKIRIVGDTFKSRGWFAKTGANTEEHLTNILNSGELSAILEDTRTGKILAMVEQLRAASYNWTVDARGIVGENVEFVAIRIKDESEI